MRLFEADCPRQLVTEMGLDQRRRRAEQVGRNLLSLYYLSKVKMEVSRMHKDANGANDGTEINQEDLKGPMLKGIFNGMFKEGLKEIFKGVFRMKVLGL